MLQGILLVTALSLDSFLAAFAYAVRKIRIPFYSAAIIALVSVFFLMLSFLLAALLVDLLPAWAVTLFSAFVFGGLSLYSFFQSSIKRMLRRCAHRLFRFHYGNVSFVLQIYLDEVQADQDRSKTLSAKEALYLAVALSLDSLLSGLAFGLALSDFTIVLIADFAVALASIYLGSCFGQSAACHSRFDLDWLSGALFALLALSRFL